MSDDNGISAGKLAMWIIGALFAVVMFLTGLGAKHLASEVTRANEGIAAVRDSINKYSDDRIAKNILDSLASLDLAKLRQSDSCQSEMLRDIIKRLERLER